MSFLLDWIERIRRPLLKRRVRQEIIFRFGKLPTVGDVVCDCRYRHQVIRGIYDDEDVILEDGHRCSLLYCCDPPDHEWTHPEEGI